MRVLYGTSPMGHIHSPGGDRFATRFFHIWFLPLLPLGSIRAGSDGRVEEIPLHIPSMMLAWLRTFGFFLAALLAFWGSRVPFGNPAIAFIAMGIGLLMMVGVAFSWFWIGREKQRPIVALIVALVLCAPVILLSTRFLLVM